MSKMDMTGIAVLCAVGLFAITVAASVAPDLRRYIKLRRM